MTLPLSETSRKSTSPDQTPPRLVVWVCPKCGYWRPDKSTGVHVAFVKGRDERHQLSKAVYIYEGG